jgi:hypothetical protein
MLDYGLLCKIIIHLKFGVHALKLFQCFNSFIVTPILHFRFFNWPY